MFNSAMQAIFLGVSALYLFLTLGLPSLSTYRRRHTQYYRLLFKRASYERNCGQRGTRVKELMLS